MIDPKYKKITIELFGHSTWWNRIQAHGKYIADTNLTSNIRFKLMWPVYETNRSYNFIHNIHGYQI